MLVKVSVDPAAPGSEELMQELSRQLTALDVGDVQTIKQKGPEGTLSLATVVVVLQIAYWTSKAGKALLDVVRDIREKHSVSHNLTLKDVPPIRLVAEGKTTTTLSVPAKQADEDTFLRETESAGGDQ